MTVQNSVAPAAGADATNTFATNVVTDIANLLATTYGPFQKPASPYPRMFRIMPYTAAFAVGGFNSDGWLNDGNSYCLKDHYTTTKGSQNSAFTTTNTTPTTLTNNIPILLPPHDALTVTRVEGSLMLGVASAGAGDTATLDQYDVVLIKVNTGTGAETVLETVVSSGTTTSQTGQTHKITERTFSKSLNAGAGYTLTSSERLGIRIKLYGRTSNAGAPAYITFNTTSGATYNAAGTTDYSRVIFTLS